MGVILLMIGYDKSPLHLVQLQNVTSFNEMADEQRYGKSECKALFDYIYTKCNEHVY